MFYILARKAIGDIGDLTEIIRACALRIDLKFVYGYGSLPVTPIASGLEAPTRHGEKHGFYPSASFLFFHL